MLGSFLSLRSVMADGSWWCSKGDVGNLFPKLRVKPDRSVLSRKGDHRKQRRREANTGKNRKEGKPTPALFPTSSLFLLWCVGKKLNMKCNVAVSVPVASLTLWVY